MLVMRTGPLLLLLLLLTALCSIGRATEAEEKAAKEDVEDRSSSAADSEDKSPGSGKFFLKSYSTTTWTFLSSFTSTIPYTCYSSAGPLDPCMGRRLRRSRKLRLAPEDDATAAGGGGIPLSSSQDEQFSRDTPDREGDLGRRFFTIWRTSSTTVTITTFSTNRSVTVSASVACSFPGAIINAC